MIIGITAVVVDSSSGLEADKLVVGIVLLIISFIFQGAQFVVEEKLFQSTYLNPNRLVGFEGLFGMLITLISIDIVVYIPCPDFMKSSCPNGMMEDSYQFFD